MSNLANNHNKVSSSHCAQSAQQAMKRKNFTSLIWATKLYETCEIHCLDNPGTAGLCTQNLLF